MSDPSIDLSLLRAFVAVAETGSFTAAADAVGRSQSAVSQKVLRLEEALEMRVFERTSRALSLTVEGERLLAAGRQLLAHYDVFLQSVRTPTPATTLRLGISENLVQMQLPRLLSRFTQRYPDVRMELITSASQALFEDYEAGQLDVVIAKTRKGQALHGGRVIWREPLVWIAGGDFRNDHRRPARLVMMRPPCGYREVMTQTLNSARREWVTAVTASSLAGVQAAVLGGLGVTALGKSFVQPGMRLLPPSEHWPALPATEVSVAAQVPGMQQMIEPLIALLTEVLLESGGAPPASGSPEPSLD